jgi:uncharacterized protein with GYD domain
LVAVWGTIREEVEAHGGEINATYAVLGAYDFYIVFAVPDGETAFQVTQAIERNGLDTTTMRAPTRSARDARRRSLSDAVYVGHCVPAPPLT